MTAELIILESSARTLDDIADSIRAHWQAFDDDRFAIGHDLLEARAQFADNISFGQWFASQGFAFSRIWGYTLRLAADNEPAVRKALLSQLNNGKTTNFEKAVKAVTHPPVEPADEPPEPKKRKPISARTNVTEAHQKLMSIDMNLAQLGPDDVIPAARPIIRAWVYERFIDWVALWTIEDE